MYRPRLALGAAGVMLTLCLALAACSAANNSPSTPLTNGNTPIATSNPVNATGWQTYTDPKLNYSIDIPPGLHLVESGVQGMQPGTQGSNPTWVNADQTVMVVVQALPQQTPDTLACSQGTPIMIGQSHNIPARQQTITTGDGTPPPNSGAYSGYTASQHVGLSAQTVYNGVTYFIGLYGPPPQSNFMAQYNATWQRMLGSFVPSTSVSNANISCAK